MTIPYIAKATPKTPVWFAPKHPIESRRFVLDTTSLVNLETNGYVASVSAQAAPSGVGELVLSDLRATPDGIHLTIAGGQPTRVYSIAFVAQMSGGEVFEFLVNQGIPPGLPGYAIPLPPDPGYGGSPAITWQPTLRRCNIDYYNSGAVYASREAGRYDISKYNLAIYASRETDSAGLYDISTYDASIYG